MSYALLTNRSHTEKNSARSIKNHLSRGNDLATFLLHKFTFFCVTSFYAFVLICPHKRFIHSRFKNISAFLFLFSTDF